MVEYINKGDIYELPQAEIQHEIDLVQRKLFAKPWEKDDSDESDLEEQLLLSIQELILEVITIKALLEETMDANQKLHHSDKYLENKYTKGNEKINFEN